MAMEIDSETEARLRRLAEARHTSLESLLREALANYPEQVEKPEKAAPGQHPSGRPWPRRAPVGGIITPV